MNAIINAIAQTSYLEWAAIATTTLCIILAGRNNVHTWWTGIVACILYGVLFFEQKLYADVTLQVFFVATSLYGWFYWGVNDLVQERSTPPDYASKKYMLVSLGVGVVGALVYGWLLHTFTDAWAPFIDSGVLTGSIVAQFLLMRRNVQTWPMWIVVNTLSVPLYFSRELYVTSLMYGVFWINAVWSWYNWRNLASKG